MIGIDAIKGAEVIFLTGILGTRQEKVKTRCFECQNARGSRTNPSNLFLLRVKNFLPVAQAMARNNDGADCRTLYEVLRIPATASPTDAASGNE
jgi:hypothetical protein